MNKIDIIPIKIKSNYNRFIQSFYKKHGNYKIYSSKYGIKFLGNSKFLLQNNIQNFLIDRKNLSTNDLFLGIDFLKDKYTLINTCINDSPHYYLMEALLNNINILKTDYVNRMAKGCLDERRELPEYLNKKNYFLKCFYKKKIQIEKNNIEPIKIYIVKNKFYIYDGKHRAAMHALLNKKVECDIYDRSILYNLLQERFEKMLIEEKKFLNNINFLKTFIKNCNELKENYNDR